MHRENFKSTKEVLELLKVSGYDNIEKSTVFLYIINKHLENVIEKNNVTIA